MFPEVEHHPAVISLDVSSTLRHQRGRSEHPRRIPCPKLSTLRWPRPAAKAPLLRSSSSDDSRCGEVRRYRQWADKAGSRHTESSRAIRYSEQRLGMVRRPARATGTTESSKAKGLTRLMQLNADPTRQIMNGPARAARCAPGGLRWHRLTGSGPRSRVWSMLR